MTIAALVAAAPLRMGASGPCCAHWVEKEINCIADKLRKARGEAFQTTRTVRDLVAQDRKHRKVRMRLVQMMPNHPHSERLLHDSSY